MTGQSKVSGRKFLHSKTGNVYLGLAIGVHTETQEELVVYTRLGAPDKVWIRPLSMFFEEVEINGKKVPRFRPVDEEGEE